MKNITLAIPFYNTSKYFEKAIKFSLENDLISEIVVNDDFSRKDELKNLEDIIQKINSDKISLFRNQKNLGGFRNKYNAVKNSKSEWIYLLDSDNYLYYNTLDIVSSIQDPDPNICYIPETLLLRGEDGYENEVNYNFKYEKIGIDEAQDALLKKVKWFDWFLNTGNFIFNRESYLNKLLSGYENQKEPVYACSIAFSYHWMINGGFYKVVPGMKYYHRLRSDSYWNLCGNNSNISREYYINKIVNLE